jgi:hypothetical protein
MGRLPDFHIKFKMDAESVVTSCISPEPSCSQFQYRDAAIPLIVFNEETQCKS